MSITGVYSSLGGAVWSPALVTVMIAAVWVGIAVAACSSSPLATLTLAGALYGVLAIVLQQISWNLILGGALEGTPSSATVLVMSWASILLTNTIWGAFLGLLAAGACRLLPGRDTVAQEGCVTVSCRKL